MNKVLFLAGVVVVGASHFDGATTNWPMWGLSMIGVMVICVSYWLSDN